MLLERFPGKCTRCGTSLGASAERSWIDVARVSNLAEAGFLTDELAGMDIDARIHQLDEFSAVTDRWATVYFIRVPNEQASDAASWIRQQLAEDAGVHSDRGAGQFSFSTSQETIDVNFWRPVVLVVLAGVSSFMLGQRFSDADGGRRPPRNSLSSAVGAIGRPLVSEPGPGLARHRLLFDRRRDAWYLDVDQNGDGMFDHRHRFHASGASW
jgi:hypothetical protein